VGGGEQEEEELPLTSVTETTSHHGSRSSSPLRGGHIPAEARPGGASSPDPRTPPPCPATARPRLRAPARVNKAGWCAGEAQTSLGLGSGPPEPGISLMGVREREIVASSRRWALSGERANINESLILIPPSSGAPRKRSRRRKKGARPPAPHRPAPTG
jgi:hypothetical protein